MSLALDKARQCLTTPPFVYTPDDAEQCYGATFTPKQREALRVIPFSEETLKGCAGTHMLFPSLPLSLLNVRDNHPDHFSKGDVWYAQEREAFARVPLLVRWHLLRMETVLVAFDETSDRQLALL